VLLVSRERYRLPLPPNLARKFDALETELDVRVLASARGGGAVTDPRFALVRPLRPRLLDGPAFYLALPGRVARELRRFRPEAILVQGVHEAVACLVARRLASVHTGVILDLQGDWHEATRLYGSRLRRLLNPLNDWLGRIAVRRVDGVRTVSTQTTALVRELGVEPAATFPAYVDPTAFLGRPPVPLPHRPRALFVGVLERSKNVDGLVAAWRLAAPGVPDAELHIVGWGSLAEDVRQLVRDRRRQTRWLRSLPNPRIAAALDASTVLVLPSRSEGLPRVALEAFARGRAVIGGRAAGIPDVVKDGRNGLLVDPEDPAELADAIVRVLSDRPLAEQLGAAARDDAEHWVPESGEYARHVRELIETVG
jgi:glycosyltransferase involved in cell wall biosynthesis